MKRAFGILALAVALGGCPSYDRIGKISDEHGQVSSDEYARYGQDQAQVVAIGREYGHFIGGASVADRIRAADSATAFGRRFPAVENVSVDTLGGWVTVEFRDGWRTYTTPLTDGKRGCETPNLPAGGPCAANARRS